ncbi:hypothetical protein EMIHUDRAFT_237648 [Emiliania huxleyi CCMP1516]|uniref:FAD dependent oxidoreductase domain-containing protein n=2 Tax=Emiliania huxleyi TaxID=2903 RepID=A0A0D3JPT7_EMIH1|nr:hypothetical protein EMIHUDRAFT_237648 [Emiliania huxleyi CCMP1516]EOD25522.1 hypothetical protein EMIHUDRAFT_237648 [Emiliania huxleyi CCMP1516]|eukprot:XP_005777951.1 hypothetical protein EMIHUDRAFT_237648 [Emiliania huxleyi CCMP1516]
MQHSCLYIMVRRTWDAVVVGGGVVGCAVLRELTVRRGWRCLLVERQPHLVAGASAGNTGIACTASDVATGTVEHACLSEGARLNLPAWTELNVPHRPTGSMYAAFDADGLSRLEAELEMRRARGDPDAALLTAAEARAREPALAPSVLGALLVAGEVTVDPWLAPIAYARHAHENGATIQRGREVAAAAWEGGVYVWRSALGVVACGPTAEPVREVEMPPREEARPEVRAALLDAACAAVPQLREAGVAGSYSGLRPGCDLSADYQIGRAEGSSWVTVGAIRSTGLTGALGIARRAAALCDEAVVFGADEAGFGPHLVTHPLTAAGLDAQLAGMLRGTAL